jgi:hypothetical protein
LVPPAPKKKKKKTTGSSPSKPVPDSSAPGTTSTPEAMPAPPPESSSAKPIEAAPTPPPEAAIVKDKATAPCTSSSGQQSLVLHVGPAATAAVVKPSGALGRITQLKRAGRDLGHLLPYAEKWNAADISVATRGLGKDRLPVPDPAGPRCTEEQFIRLRRAVKELDNAWHDATSNVVVSLLRRFLLMPVSVFFRLCLSPQSPSFVLRAQLLA